MRGNRSDENRLSEVKKHASGFWQNKPLRNRTGWGLAIFFVLQLYFVRELIAAELAFRNVVRCSLFALASLFYVVGTDRY